MMVLLKLRFLKGGYLFLKGFHCIYIGIWTLQTLPYFLFTYWLFSIHPKKIWFNYLHPNLKFIFLIIISLKIGRVLTKLLYLKLLIEIIWIDFQVELIFVFHFEAKNGLINLNVFANLKLKFAFSGPFKEC